MMNKFYNILNLIRLTAKKGVRGVSSLMVKRAGFMLIVIFTHLTVYSQTGNIWYNYSVDNNDNWDDWKRWTLDPDGSLLINPGMAVPGAADTVIILNGSTVNITTNNKTAAVLEIRSGGILNVSGTTTGHNFAVIRGDGRIILAADNYPTGNDADFSNRGTVEFTGGSTTYLLNTLNTSKTFFNLIINLNNPTDSVTLTDSITIKNDLEIRRGNFKINDTTSNRKLTINVLNNLTIQSDGKITTGKGNPFKASAYTYASLPPAGQFHTIYHELFIGGSFTNFGRAEFSNLSAPLYNNFATNGAVTVTFNGSGNNNINLYGPVKFYNLIINKGTNQAYVTTLYSANTSYFSLLGGNTAERFEGAPFTASNPEIRKALWIRNGTLKLTGNVTIPTLTESGLLNTLGDYTIPANGCLWIDGANVTVNGTANAPAEVPGSTGIIGTNTDTYQGLAIFGKFRISQGTYNGKGSSGIQLYSDDATMIQIEGGTVDICQFRNDLFAAGGKATYQQSGGTVNIRGDKTALGEVLFTNALFELLDANSVFIMSGGVINFYDESSNWIFRAPYDLYINSATGNYNVTGGTINVKVDAGIDFNIYSTANLWNLNVQKYDNAGTATVVLGHNLTVSNDLTIYENAEFDNNSYNINIGENLTIGTVSGSNALFTARNDTTTFNGTSNSIITVSSNANYFNPNHFIIDKTSSSGKVTMAYRPGTLNTVVGRVRGNFTLFSGIFDYSAYNLEVSGNLDNNGVMGVWNTRGRIILNNTAAVQTITGGTGPGILFGHLEVAHTDGNANNVQLNSNVSCDLFTLTSGRVFIQNYKLSVDTNFVTFTQAGTPASRMIYTTNDHGNRGLQLKMSGNYTTQKTITFPVGALDGTTPLWTKADIVVPATLGNISGYLIVAPVPLEHPTKNSQSCEISKGYWKVTNNGLPSGTTAVQYQFTNNFTISANGQTKQYYLRNGVWQDDGNAGTPLTINKNFGFSSIDVTAGKNSCFNNVNYVYSNGTGGGPWNAGASWDLGNVPATYDYAVIRKGDIISANSGADDAGTVIINAGGTLDVGNITGLSYGIISGGGKFRIASNTANTSPTLPSGDFDPFLTNDSAIFEYYGTANYTLPTVAGTSALNYYPNLKIGGSANTVKTLPATNITVRKNLMIYDDNNTGVVLALNTGNNLTVQDSIKLDNQGVLRFPAAGTARSVIVGKSIDFAANSNNDANRIEIENAAGTWNNFHSLYINEDIRMNDNSFLTLYRTKTNRRAVNLYFRGSTNSQITQSSSSNISLNYLSIEKDDIADTVSILSDFSLTDDNDRPVTLTSGSLILNNAGINVSLTSGEGNFTIPNTGSLTLTNGTVRVSGNGNGIILNNRLRLQHSSQLLMTNLNQNNFIEYSSTGNSELLIEDSARLTVGGPIRRSLNTEAGSLIYRQTGTGSIVTVGDTSAGNPSRAMFEIMNPGSNFTLTGGNLIIGRGQNTTDPALYLDPETYSISSGTKIIFGNIHTPTNQTLGIYSAIPLKDLEVSNAGAVKSVKVYTLPLIIDSLRILNDQTFNANGNDINLKGNLHLFSGAAYTPGSNTTAFSGSQQKIIGGITFSNLTISSADSVRIYNDIIINDSLTIASGSQISDRRNKITLKGNILNNGRHYSESMTTGGIIFQGTSRQKIAGAGTYGILIVNNSNGVELENNFTLVDRNVHLLNGSFYLREFQLAIGEKANFTAAGGFSKDRMLVTNGAVSDFGIKKYVPAGTSSDILFPIGVMGKYTPVIFSNLSVTENGYIFIRPVNLAHPTVLDPANVLQYYWNIQTSDFTSFNARMNFKYIDSDVRVTAPNLESDYIPAYLNDISWAKFGPENVDEVNDTISFTFNTGTNIDGDFTAGINTAIPDQVPVYYTTKNGNWEDPSVWAREDGLLVTAFPNGYVVRVRHNITVTSDLKSAYRTIIEQGGKIDVGTTIRHYFGRVSGRGHLSIGTGRLPAGNYQQFFDCSGGTMEYGGTANYEIPNESMFYRRLVFSGSGTKVLPSSNITVCDTLLINGPVVDNSTHNNRITVNGLFELASGTFNAGTGPNAAVVFAGTNPQNIKGNFTGASKLNNIVMNNSAGLTLGGNVTMAGKLTLTNGNITTESNAFLMEIASTVSPAAGSASSFINGTLQKMLANGSSFTFPIGKNSRYGHFSVSNTNTASEQIWSAEYFNSAHADNTYASPLTAISNSEYWKLTGPAAGTTYVSARWDAQSDITPLTVSGISNMRLAEYNTGPDWVNIPGTASGNDVSGTVTSTSAVTPGIASKYYTLGSAAVTPPKARIRFSSSPQVCSGVTNNITVTYTYGSPNYTFTYSINGSGSYTPGGLPNSTNPFSFTGTTPGRYRIISFTANGVSGVIDTTSVWVNPNPTVNLTSSDADNTICSGTGITITATTGSANYNFRVNGTGVQNSASNIYTSSSLANGNNTLSVIATSAQGCSSTSSGLAVTVNPLPTASLSGTASICDGQSVDIQANLTGSGSWNITYTDGTTPQTLNNITSPHPITVNPASTKTYSITAVSDSNGCVGTSFGTSAVITVNPLPATGPVYRQPNN